MQLECESGDVIDDVTADELARRVAAEEFVILSPTDDPAGNTYIQCAQPGDESEPEIVYLLEYQEVDIDHHYEAVDHPIDADRVTAAMSKYLAGDDSWKSDFTWELLDLSDLSDDDDEYEYDDEDE